MSDQQTINGSAFLHVTEPKPCFMCRQPTRLLSVEFEAPIHAGCAEEAWAVVLSAAQYAG